MPRHAVYFTPPANHALWQAGCAWLGRDPAAVVTPPARAHVQAPWRYGFHATLKPPMALADGRSEASLHDAVGALAARTPRFALPPLAVLPYGDFIALSLPTPLAPEHPLRQLADACVVQLDSWRAPPSAAELQRRLAQPLDAEQIDLLQRHGYQHVLARWRFHMTLTDGLADNEALRQQLLHEAEDHFAQALAQPLVCDALSLFTEPGPGEPFRLVQRYALA